MVEHLILVMLAITAIKAMTIGSKFNFALWMKHGKKYYQWYEKNIVEKEYEE